MNSISSTALDTCGCCAASPPGPALYNRPGLPALSYRISTHPQSLQRMLARLPRQRARAGSVTTARPLAQLTTRALDDPAIALLDAWATLADVLTLYQERIANEGYIRTATERRSVLELARTIGYELRPGVAAGTYLAFAVESAPGAPASATVPAGTRVQGVPAQGQLPQTFETMADITARAEWNTLRPRLSQPQTLVITAQSLYLAGTTTNLKLGDVLLLVAPQDSTASGLETTVVRIQKVVLEPALQRTRVDLIVDPSPPPVYIHPTPPRGDIVLDKIPLIDESVRGRIVQRTWHERDLRAFLGIQGWRGEEMLTYVRNNQLEILSPPPSAARTALPTSPGVPALPPATPAVFAFRARTAFFGNNAPLHSTLPDKLTQSTGPFAKDWDANGGTTIWTDSQGKPYGPSGADVYLERELPQVLPNGWVVFESPQVAATAYRIARVSETALADYLLTARTTGLTLVEIDGANAPNTGTAFTTRATTAYAQSEALDLADLPIDDLVAQGTTSLLLDTMVLGLNAGQPLAVSGERADLPGVIANEIAILADAVHALGYTTLQFQQGLQFSYARKTMAINANVAAATHGGTVLKEVLGSGDGSQTNQRFTLKKPPLTFVSAPTPNGAQSTLQVQVNGVLWQEAPSLYNLDGHSECYIVRIDEDGKASVIFGDGAMGARLPSGSENVVATYRSGIGQQGMVAAGSLTLLQTRPLGIRSVTNPSDSSGAADPEGRDNARANAPLTVLTLDRIVSLGDAEDYARAFAGIGKAQAVALWLGDQHLVHITVAATNGAAVDQSSPLYTHLVTAIARSADPVLSYRVASYQPLFFNLTARVLVDTPRYQSTSVLAAVQAALASTFSFDQRDFAQPVTAAEIVTTMQAVPGVKATDLQLLYLVTDASGPQQTTPKPVLQAQPARRDTGQILPSQLLMINPAGVTLAEMT